MNDLIIQPAGSPVVGYLGRPIGRIKAAAWQEFFRFLESDTDVGDSAPSVTRAVLDNFLSRCTMAMIQDIPADILSSSCFYDQHVGGFHKFQYVDGTRLKAVLRMEPAAEDQIPNSWTLSLEGLVS